MRRLWERIEILEGTNNDGWLGPKRNHENEKNKYENHKY